MVTTERLLILIASLEPYEKRSFRLMVDRQEGGGKQQYMVLFNLMERSIAKDLNGDPVYNLDEAALITRMRRKGVLEHRFHGVRHILAQMLFKALRQLQEDKTQEDAIKILLKEAKVMERRGYFDWAIEHLEEAFELARQFEYYALAIEALQNLVVLRGQQDARGYAAKIGDDVREIEQLTKRLSEEQHYFSLQYQTLALYRTRKGMLSADLSREVEQLLNQSALNEPGAAKSFLSQIYYHYVHALLEDLKGENEKSKRWFEQIIDLWESGQYKHMQLERPRQFIVHLANYLGFALRTQDFEAYHKHFKTLEAFKPANFDDEAEVFQNKVYLQQLYLLNHGPQEDAQKLIPAIERGLKKYAHKINKSRFFTIRYHIVLTHFVLGEYGKALENCEILLKYKSDQRRDLQSFTSILHHITHLELEEFDALEKFVKGVKNNMITLAGPKDFERIVLTYLVQLAEIYLKDQIASRKRTEALKRVFELFERELLDYQAVQPQVPLGFEEILFWVRKRLKG